MIFKGDTVRLKVDFKDFDGNDIDPKSPTLTLYDHEEKQLEEVELDDTNHEDVGVYSYDYTVPDDIFNYFVYEFRGIHKNKTILKRGEVEVKFS